MRSAIDIFVFCLVGVLTLQATGSMWWAAFSVVAAGAYSVFVFWSGVRKAKWEPVGFMSEMQIPLIKDPEDDSGHYIPMRKTQKGNFQLALYALTKDKT